MRSSWIAVIKPFGVAVATVSVAFLTYNLIWTVVTRAGWDSHTFVAGVSMRRQAEWAGVSIHVGPKYVLEITEPQVRVLDLRLSVLGNTPPVIFQSRPWTPERESNWEQQESKCHTLGASCAIRTAVVNRSTIRCIERSGSVEGDSLQVGFCRSDTTPVSAVWECYRSGCSEHRQIALSALGSARAVSKSTRVLSPAA